MLFFSLVFHLHIQELLKIYIHLLSLLIIMLQQGTIFKFFKNSNCSSSKPKLENGGMIQGTKASWLLRAWASQNPFSSFFIYVGSSPYQELNLDLEANQVELPKERPPAECTTNSGQNVQREAWDYKIDEIDPSVIDELPQEIQAEVRSWFRPLKRPNTVKRSSTIAHYFSPAKAP